MKKLFVLMLAALLVVAFAIPASALENKFGGMWRTRFMSYGNYNGKDTGGNDYSAVDTRTRLYYTAILHENLKFVNKFEIDTVWGDTVTGDIGADGTGKFEIKNTYADFNLNKFNFVIGVQGFDVHRALLFSDDASGMKIIYRGMKGVTPAFYWIRAYEGMTSTTAGDPGKDADYYVGLVNIKRGNMQFVPAITYLTANSGTGTTSIPTGAAGEPEHLYYIGLDFIAKFDMINLEMTGIYNGGSLKDTGTNRDVSAYLFDAKVKAKLSNFGVHGEVLYATGDDDATDNDQNAFQAGAAPSYNWTEGYSKGIYDAMGFKDATTGLEEISNVMAFNLGVTFSASKDLSFKLDYWNINLAEEDASGDRAIGNELSAIITYKLLKGLTLDLVGAYLITGDAFESTTTNRTNPYELVAQLSLKF